MEHGQLQTNISHLLNADALLGRFTGAADDIALAPVTRLNTLTAVDLDHTPLSIREHTTLESKDRQNLVILNEVFCLLLDDVLHATNQVLSINPGRRTLIERRLEVIAHALKTKTSKPITIDDISSPEFRLVWESFAAEAALYQMLELFFLKCLDYYGWRSFESKDIGRLNFSAHGFLNTRATGFAFDKHCWNFVRTNLYSWYVPSTSASCKLTELLENLSLAWNDKDLGSWISELPKSFPLQHLTFNREGSLTKLISDLIEKQLQFRLTHDFQGQRVCKRIFFPTIESGMVPLSIFELLLEKMGDHFTGQNVEFSSAENSQFSHALWACDSESLEVFWTEVMSLLKLLRTFRNQSDLWRMPSSSSRLPHTIHIVQLLGLELHNQEQLPLSSTESPARMHLGSAAQIQQLEAFDLSIVLDYADRAKSSRWIKALSEQLPYWRKLVSSGSNLNWGELHLYLALSKLKEDGICIYVSHRVLPEGGDGEKLRKSVLGMTTLQYFVELPEGSYDSYRYLYIFKRKHSKMDRDQHRPRFGVLSTTLSRLEEANSTQAEISERGWDHMFVRGAAPLVRHLNHKFPKLFQLASVQHWNPNSRSEAELAREKGLFSGQPQAEYPFLEIISTSNQEFQLKPLKELPKENAVLICPHNPVDLPWIRCLLESPPVHFWVRNELSGGTSKALRWQEIRSAPILDLTHAPTEYVHSSLDWIGKKKPTAVELKAWACKVDSAVPERHAKYFALSKRHAGLERLVERYRPLFTSSLEIKPDAVTQFYPSSMMAPILQRADVKIQFVGRNNSKTFTENWVIADSHLVIQRVPGKQVAQLVLNTRNGGAIQILVPEAIGAFLNSQVQHLMHHTWAELAALLKIPRDICLFQAQVSEITRVLEETIAELHICESVLHELSIDLYEISTELRPFLKI